METKFVVLPLSKLFDRRSGLLKYASRLQLMNAFKIDPSAEFILSGTDHDAAIERWWGFQEPSRRAGIRALGHLGVRLVTTPNYSLFLDRPRWDDLHSIKRIGLVHSEFLSEGVNAALHVNGRTETDFARWTEFVASRTEVTDIAYEFTTGAAWSRRKLQHALWLCQLAKNVRRPLRLIVRGGSEILPLLNSSFAAITVVTSTAFMKTMKRRVASPLGNSKLQWLGVKTPEGAPLDDLLKSNVETVEQWLLGILLADPLPLRVNE